MPARLLGPLVLLGLGLAADPTFAHVGPDEQLRDLDARIATEPMNAGLYLHRGELLRARGDLLPALRDFEGARTLDPTSAEPDFHAGRAMLEAGLPAEAIGPLDRALAMRPGHLDARTSRGRARARLGRHAEAAADFTIAIRSYPPGTSPQPDLYTAGAPHPNAAPCS